MKPAPKNRIRPIEAVRALIAASRNPDDTENGARFVLALQGNRSEQNFQRFVALPQGQRLLTERRALIDVLRDREWLRALPEGSLGRAYLHFVEAEDLSADGLREIVDRADPYYTKLDADRRRLHDHIGAQHDLWHVLTGYGRDIVGELLLVCFSWRQLRTRAFVLIIGFAYLFKQRETPGFRKLAREALRRGRDAAWLPVQDWEDLLQRPIDEVRELTGVGPPAVYTPERTDGAPQLAPT